MYHICNKCRNDILKMRDEKKGFRLTPIMSTDRCQLWEDVYTKKYYCLYKKDDGTLVWHRAAYVGGMKKEDWDNWNFGTEKAADWFTDLVAFCEISGEVEYEDGIYIEWYELLCDHPDVADEFIQSLEGK